MIPPEAEWVYADPRALQQVLLNLYQCRRCWSGTRTSEDRNVRLRLEDMVIIQVKDNGCGIPEDKVKDLFRPFYTTKVTGTGLGLVIVKKMIARMNGTIEIASQKDTGPVVSIILPEGS